MNEVPISSDEGDMLEEYDFSQGARGKYAAAYSKGTNVVVLAPDVAAVFHDSESVNQALRLLIQVAERTSSKDADHN